MLFCGARCWHMAWTIPALRFHSLDLSRLAAHSFLHWDSVHAAEFEFQSNVCVYKKVNIICHGRVTQNVVDTFVLRRQFKNDMHPMPPYRIFIHVRNMCLCFLCVLCVCIIHIFWWWLHTMHNVCLCGCSGAVFIIWCLFYSNIIQTRLHALGIEKSLWKRQHSIQQTHNAIALPYTYREREREREWVTTSMLLLLLLLPLLLVFHFTWGSLSHIYSLSLLLSLARSISFSTPLCTRYTAVNLPFVLILYSTKSRVVGSNWIEHIIPHSLLLSI